MRYFTNLLSKKTKIKICGIIAPEGKISLRNIIIFTCTTIIIVILFLILYIHILSPKKSGQTNPHWKSYKELVASHELAPAGKILQVTLSNDSSKLPQLSLANLTIYNGYAPNPVLHESGLYIIQYLDESGSLLYEQRFDIQNQIFYDEVNTDGALSGGAITVAPSSLVLTLPWDNNAKLLRVLDENGQEIFISPLLNIQTINNKPDFKSIRGDEFIKNVSKTLNFNFLPRVSAQPANNTVRIAFVSIGYTDMNEFHSYAEQVINNLLSYEPYKTRASQISFSYIDSITDFQCKPMDFQESGMFLMYKCNYVLIKNEVNSAGVPYDYIDLIFNNKSSMKNGRAHANITEKIAFNGNSDKIIDFTHEVGGHLIGQLMDEYTSQATLDKINNMVYTLDPRGGYMPGDGNCYAGLPPAQEWDHLIQLPDYRKGCTYPNWYRSSGSSLMYDAISGFNIVSQCVINRRLDILAGTFPGSNPQCYTNTPINTSQPALSTPSATIVISQPQTGSGFESTISAQPIISLIPPIKESVSPSIEIQPSLTPVKSVLIPSMSCLGKACIINKPSPTNSPYPENPAYPSSGQISSVPIQEQSSSRSSLQPTNQPETTPSTRRSGAKNNNVTGILQRLIEVLRKFFPQ